MNERIALVTGANRWCLIGNLCDPCGFLQKRQRIGMKGERILVNAVCPGWVATDMGGSGGRPVAVSSQYLGGTRLAASPFFGYTRAMTKP